MHNFNATKNKWLKGFAIKLRNDAIFFLLLIRVKYKEVEREDKAGNWKEDEIFTELIPCFISVFCFPTDFQQ